MNLTDADILAAIRKNRDRGFSVLVEQYSQRIYWHIRRMVVAHHDAEDVTQDTFLRVFRSLDKLKSADSLCCWIYRIATNEALRFIEHRSEQVLPLDAAAEMASESYVDYSDIEAVELKRAISRLPARQQAVFNLRYYDELEYSDIAAILDTTVQNVRSNFSLAKERIVTYMNSIDWSI